MPTNYVPRVKLTIKEAQEDYTANGVCRPWSGDAILRHQARMLEAHTRAMIAEDHLNEVCS